MLNEIFKNIILMSAVGSILSILLLLIKPITQKIFSPRWQYYIWLTVLIVMILPVRFSLPNQISAVPTAKTIQSENIVTKTLQQNEKINNYIQRAQKMGKISSPKINLPHNISYYLSYIWFFGAVFVFFTKIVKYLLFLKAIHRNSEIYTNISNIPKRLKVRQTNMLDAPLIVGIFKPILFLPSIHISKNDMNYILMHELTHYKRRDLLYKWFVMAVLSIHWFNPFVYIVSKQVDEECEISCDFSVTSKLSDSEKNNYMNMILDLLSNSKSHLRPLTTQMASSKKTLKRRFTIIRNKKSTNKIISAISVFLAIIMVSTTVFASGILNDLKTKDYNNGEKIELSKKPFIENCEVYVPLQEMFDKIGIMNNDKLINFSPIFTFVSLDVTSLETNDTLKITKKNDLDFVTDLLENSNYENKPCDGIADYRITYNNSTYDILMSCHEIKRGNKQAEITDNDIEKLKNVFANAKQTK